MNIEPRLLWCHLINVLFLVSWMMSAGLPDSWWVSNCERTKHGAENREYTKDCWCLKLPPVSVDLLLDLGRSNAIGQSLQGKVQVATNLQVWILSTARSGDLCNSVKLSPHVSVVSWMPIWGYQCVCCRELICCLNQRESTIFRLICPFTWVLRM